MNETVSPEMQIKEACLVQKSCDPVAIAVELMRLPGVPMHGPVHHILDGSALLTAIHNAGEKFDLPAALDEMAVRGSRMPGATCGMWGVCGSASSVGAALAILHETGPLSSDENYKNNLRLTSRSLSTIAEIGGPRCCKRNAYISLQTAAEFLRSAYGIPLDTAPFRCEFYANNAQCLGKRCPFRSADIGKQQ